MQPVYIEIHNFKSIKDIKLDLTKFKDKTVLIQATNEDDAGALSNRGGKSNLMKALVWGLFGVSFIEGTSDEITTYGEKETFVIVRFDTGAEIERRFKNKAQTFFYRKNGKDESDSNKDAEALFLKDIGLDTKNKAIISNGVYLNTGVDNLISSTAGDRLKTMTEWFDLSRYDKAVEYARSKLKEWQTELSAIDSEREKAQSAQASLEENKTKLVQIEQDIRDLKDKEIKLRDRQKDFDSYSGLSDNLFLLEEKLREIQDENTDTEEAKKAFSKIDIKALEDKKELLDKALIEYKQRISEINLKLVELQSQLVNPYICPHCKTSLVLSNKELVEVSLEANEQIKRDMYLLDLELSEAKKPESSSNIELEIREYYRLKPFSEKAIIQTRDIETQIKDLKAKIETKPKDYSTELKELNQKMMDLSFIKGEIQSKVSSCEELIEKLPELEESSKRLTELSRLALLWAGERNKVGIFQQLKSLTFSKIITNLSLYVNNILTNHFFIQSTIKIESTAKGIEIYQVVDGEAHPVSSMSAGERARVAFALALSLKKFYSTKLDILIADETFSSLDSTGMEFVINTMGTFSGMKFLISHVPCENEYQINLVKKDGVTYVR